MRKNHRHRRRRLSGAAIAVALVCAALAYAGVLLGIRTVGSRLERSDAPEPVGSLDGRFASDELTLRYADRTWTYRKRELTNLLLIGVDWAEMDSPAASGRYAGQADFLLLLTFDKKNRTISTLQIDRDTMTDIRVYGPFGDYTGIRETQICLSHAYGATAVENCENTVWAASRLLGNIPVDGYLALDMSAITALNDALGGVTVTLEEDFSALDPQMVRGATITLQGKQAETFVRGRTGVGDGTNAARMKRQKAFMQKAGDLIAEGLERDSGFAGTLLDALSGHMTMNVTRGWLINKAYESSGYRRTETRTLAGTHALGADGFTEFRADTDALNDLLTASFFE
ncbi:MAG: LCP family protein [Eubacteriales bacterium]|nr:LCP family protein [Eubacteriales bacterium]